MKKLTISLVLTLITALSWAEPAQTLEGANAQITLLTQQLNFSQFWIPLIIGVMLTLTGIGISITIAIAIISTRQKS